MARHNLRNQLRRAVFDTQNLHLGQSKHAYMKQIGYNKTRGRIYSINMLKRLMDTIEAFVKYLKATHPEIKMAVEITNEHYQEFIDSKVKQWSARTAETMVDNLYTLDVLIGKTYNRKHKFIVKVPTDVKCSDIRTIAMSDKDYLALKNHMDKNHPKSMGTRALDIAYRSGLRVSEIAGLKYTNIDLANNLIQVREGAKNGKYRDLQILTAQDKTFYANLRKECEAYYALSNNPYVCRGVKANSLNDAIRRKGLKEIGLSDKYPMTTIHAIRKNYASRRMSDLLETGMTQEGAWETVVKELGHNSANRKSLFRTYVHCK